MKAEILDLYKQKFHYDKFYDNLFYNIKTWKDDHIQHSQFLYGYPFSKKCIIFEEQRPTESGNIRVDLPVWYGDIDSKNRVVFLGLEPRDTDKMGYLNIEHLNNYVFATPFALERPEKHNRYQKAFFHLLDKSNFFFYFTDIVKEYRVVDKDNKRINDLVARRDFKEKAGESIDFLTTELSLINPTKVITLGRETFHVINKTSLKNKFDIAGVVHPARNRHFRAKNEIDDILCKI